MHSAWLVQLRILPIIIVVCFFIAVIIVKNRPSIEHEDSKEFISAAQFIKVKQYSVKPAIKGFGEVRPDILFEAKAEVSGKIVFLHPQLKEGAVFPKETVVIRIEEDDYQSSLQQAQADSNYSIAKLNEIKVTLNNTRVDLNLAKSKLQLAEKEFNRIKELLRKNLASQSDADIKQSEVIKLQQEVQTLNTRLKTLPEQQRSLEASLTSAQAATLSQQRNLERTIIRLPFNARISHLNVENNQYITQGSLLFNAQTTDKVLINAQFPLMKLRILGKGLQEEQSLIRQAFQRDFSNDLLSDLGLSATVKLSEDLDARWRGKVERFNSSIDLKTRTIGLMVSVDQPNAQIVPGRKPPLFDGMYVEATIKGKARPFYVVPRRAMHEGELFIVTQGNKLERRKLKPDLIQGEMVLFEDGLEAGEKVIVSDLFPAIPGMKLSLTEESADQQAIIDWVKQEAKP